MDIKIEQRGDKSVVILDKNLNIGSDAAKVQNTVLDLIQNGSSNIAADLSKLDYITSWGIGILIYAYTTCVNRNVEFSLLGVHDKVHSILKKVKVDKIFNIQTSN